MDHIAQIAGKLADHQLDAMLLASQAGERYAVGFHGEGLVLVTREGAHYSTDSRYIEAARQEVQGAQVELVTRERGHLALAAGYLQEHGLKRVGFESGAVSVDALARYERALPCTLVPAQDLPDGLRASKDGEELAAMEKAQRITDEAFQAILNFIRPGQTEREVAARLVYELLRRGGERVSFDPIVAAGANGSKPHAVPGDTVIQPGMFVTVDFGCVWRCVNRPGVVEKRIRRQEAKVTGVPLLDRQEQVAGAACPQEVAVSGVAQNGLHLSGDGHHLAYVDAGGDTGLVAHVDHIFRGDVAGSTGDKGTAAKTAKGGVKTGHAGLHGGHDIGHGNAAGVVEVEPPRDSGEFGVDMGTHLIDLVGDAHARGIGQGDLGDAHVQICIDDGVDLGLRDAAVPGGAEGHGNGAGDLDPVLRGGLDTVGKTGYTLLRSHIQILQVVLTAGGDIQLHLFAAAVRGALDAPQIGDQSAELHAGEFIDQSLEQVIRICHLGHLFGVHEGADLDHGEAGVHQVPQKGELILGGDDGLFVLEAVAQAHLTDGDFRG